MDTAHFRFHGSLNFFLPDKLKNQTIAHPFNWVASIKDMIESLNVPHPEIELLIVNGVSVDFSYIVQPDDRIDVYPDFDALDGISRIRLIPPYSGRPRFILDTHLGRLAAYLRMMGYDTLYRNDYDDDELAQVSHDEQRIVLTRDIGVLKRSLVIYGYYVRNTKPRLRLTEISDRYNLAEDVQPFKFCMKCNGLMSPVDKATITSELPPNTLRYYDIFHRCVSCKQIYWKGSHYERMEKIIQELQATSVEDN